ncbi:MAG: mismatch repair protein, partial [Candidatus Korobacteraceae bacterium]
EHVYAADLDLFGNGSLFEMLCTARTGIGRATLADWLLNPASPDEISSRQEAVIELRNNLELQEQWAVAGEADPGRVTSSTLAKWAEEPAIKFYPAVRGLAPILPLLMLAVCILRVFRCVGAHWPVAVGIVVALEIVLAGLAHRRTRSIAQNVTLPAFELGLLAPLLERFQREQFCSPLLKYLQSQLSLDAQTSHREIARLRLWSWLLDLRRSEYFAAASSLLLWKTNVSILVEGWRARNCRRVMAWVEVVGQFEALLCFARYSFENPEHTFPRITAEGPAFFRAENLGHPLLRASACVPCDVSLDCRQFQLMILSGSNMSGKSTLLRAVGINAVLAMAGAPVRARQLEMSALRIGCSIVVRDSLLDGKSRFLAEVERVKEILASARANKTMVLLDEVLGGTNSHDRLFGTQAVLDRLLRSGAVAIITTHDLALTELANEFPGRATNAHFEETFENGAIRFDYRLRPGVLTRTNGVNVIAALGLLS